MPSRFRTALSGKVVLVKGVDAFVFHFECFEPSSQALSGPVNTIYATFEARPLLAPVAPKVPMVDKVSY